MEALFYLALITLVVVSLTGIQLLVGTRQIKYLKDVRPLKPSEMPKVSVVIPARNEEKDLRKALSSILSQDYANLEVIVVDDRSTDRTYAILQELTATHPKLRVFRISELPSGWLGKTHAVNYGLERATGDHFLLTDADVVMESTTVSRAMTYMSVRPLDHVTVGPHIKAKGTLLNVVGLVFAKIFMLMTTPWKAKNRKSRAFMGCGAFSLMKSHVYWEIGTMKALALCVIDDMMLGKRIKRHGFRQELFAGKDLISVEWYASLKEMIEGLTKNFFAAFNYSPTQALVASGLLFVLYLWPLVGIFLTTGTTRILNGAITMLVLLIYTGFARYLNVPMRYACGYPLGLVLLLYIIWRSMVTTLLNDGVTWRETHYSLDMLKEAQKTIS